MGGFPKLTDATFQSINGITQPSSKTTHLLEAMKWNLLTASNKWQKVLSFNWYQLSLSLARQNIDLCIKTKKIMVFHFCPRKWPLPPIHTQSTSQSRNIISTFNRQQLLNSKTTLVYGAHSQSRHHSQFSLRPSENNYLPYFIPRNIVVNWTPFKLF